MAKIIVAKLNRTKKAGKASVTKKRVRNAVGAVKTLRTLDAGSRTFGTDLQYVFSKNVAKARRDNKRATGAPDVVVTKR
jgi:hypothetical protein